MLNQTLLMSGSDYFDVANLNPYASGIDPVDLAEVTKEYEQIQAGLKQAGVNIVKVAAPQDCPDGIFTANWGLCRGGRVVLASLPGPRQAEEPYAEQTLQALGKQVIKAPYRFSGQGDALPCGNYLLAGSGYRTDPQMHAFLADQLGYEVVGLHTVPQLDSSGKPVTNAASGWPDSYFYDIDLAISVLRDDLIAWCPDAFLSESREKIRALPMQKIEVSLEEAIQGFACNLVSTGIAVVMSALAPKLKSAIEAHGLYATTIDISELRKNGGAIRCTTLTLDN